MKSIEKNILLMLNFILLCIHPISAQNKFSENSELSMVSHFGYALPEYPFISYYINSHVSSFEVNYTRNTIGENKWEQLFNYPSVGVSFYHSTLGNDLIFGKATALNYFFKIPFNRGNRFIFYNQTGIGLGYISERFDIYNNPNNVAIGSHINVHFNMKFETNYLINERWKIKSGISFDHFSNGNTRDPNRGLNNLTAFLGCSYNLQPIQEKIDSDLPELNITKYFELFVNTGSKQARAFDSKRYITLSATGTLLKPITRVFHLGFGADIYYDPAVIPVREYRNENYKQSDVFQTGLAFVQAFRYNKIKLLLVEGVYLGLVNHIYKKPIYTKAQFQYCLTEKLSLRVSMKSHFHILDHPEFGIGIKL